MHEVISNRLWTGNAADARDPKPLLEIGIRAVVDLALEEPPPRLTRDIIVCRFPLIDGSGNRHAVLSAAIVTTAALLHRQIPLLVACSSGMSRSPAVSAAALGLERKQRLDAVIAECFEGKPCDLSSALWNDLKVVYDEMTRDIA